MFIKAWEGLYQFSRGFSVVLYLFEISHNKVFLRCKKKKAYQTSSVNKILKEKEKTQVNI